MTKHEFIETLNHWGRSKTPFLFLVDFEIQKPVAIKLSEVNSSEILFWMNGFTNEVKVDLISTEKKLELDQRSLLFSDYKTKFDIVKERLVYGDSFLTNLTVKIPISSNYSLKDIYSAAKAKYKLLYHDEFLVFSPETFIKIHNGKIFSYPMKGTIDASVDNAREIILNDRKEIAEHTTIVDLIRNDLSLVATDVTVKRFRYLEELKTTSKNLLQVSSEIEGNLPVDYLSDLGNIIVSLLPAGSVSGAPKKKTLEIIAEAEGGDRGYYTGAVGIFNGESVDSAVMIRYIEKQHGNLFYRSGGGITAQSEIDKEYQEIKDKIYVPID